MKYYAWELPFVERISSLRVKELDKVRSATRLWSDQQRSVSLAVGFVLGRFSPWLVGMFVGWSVYQPVATLFVSGSMYSPIYRSIRLSIHRFFDRSYLIFTSASLFIGLAVGLFVGCSVGLVGRSVRTVRRHPGEATQAAPNDPGTFASLSERASERYVAHAGLIVVVVVSVRSFLRARCLSAFCGCLSRCPLFFPGMTSGAIVFGCRYRRCSYRGRCRYQWSLSLFPLSVLLLSSSGFT